MESPGNPVAEPKDGVSRGIDFRIDAALRLLLLACSCAAVVLIVTSNQTSLVLVPGFNFSVKIPSKFTYSPAFIYLLVALSVACVYSLITTLISLSAIFKLAYRKRLLLLLAVLDATMLGMVGSADGAAIAVGYIGIRGNSHAGWNKIPTAGYEKFVKHLGFAMALSVFSLSVLLSLSMHSTYSLYKQIRD